MSVPSVIAGRYRVIRELGRGGMGAVYLVEHVHTGEQLALKVLLAEEAAHSQAVERFKREARAPAKIRSEHVVRVTDADVAPELNGAPFMVMEALDGHDLEKVVKERGKLPPGEVAWILGQVATALDKAHAIGIVHRDLKPENLFLHKRDDGSTIVKILDFGISKIQGADLAGAGLTQTGAVMGTPLYMAPEQARGQSAVMSPATDQWALGLVTLRLLTGEIYWEAETLGDLLMKIMSDPLVPPSKRYPQLTVNIDAWFARSCDRDPTRRFPSIGEQVKELTKAFSGTSLRPSNPMLMNAPDLAGTFVMGNSAQSTGSNVANAQSSGGYRPAGGASPTHPSAVAGAVSQAASSFGPSGQLVHHQTGPNAPPSQPFLQSTSGGVASNATPGARPSRGGIGIAFGIVGLLAVIGVIGIVVALPKLRANAHAGGTSSSATAEPPPTVASQPSAHASSTSPSPTPSATTTEASNNTASPPPSSSAAAQPTSLAKAPTNQPPNKGTVPTKPPPPPPTTPSTKPTGRFNPEAP